MNSEQAYQLCKEIRTIDPDHSNEPPGRPTYMLVEIAADKTASQCGCFIIDPDMPDNGNATAYLALLPVQRTSLLLADIITDISKYVLSVATELPLEAEIWKQCDNDPNKVVSVLRFLAKKAATHALSLNEVPDK